jgi:hypothetical protein
MAKHFRTAIKNGRKEVHIVDRTIFHPVVEFMQLTSVLLGKMHSGSVNVYTAYVIISLIVVLIVQMLL